MKDYHQKSCLQGLLIIGLFFILGLPPIVYSLLVAGGTLPPPGGRNVAAAADTAPSSGSKNVAVPAVQSSGDDQVAMARVLRPGRHRYGRGSHP